MPLWNLRPERFFSPLNPFFRWHLLFSIIPAMKRILLTASVLVNLVLIISADFKNPALAELKPAAPKKEIKSCGYRIVEFGKGIDCHGDTIRLEKRKGVQVRVN
jgi:hypothetical protein